MKITKIVLITTFAWFLNSCTTSEIEVTPQESIIENLSTQRLTTPNTALPAVYVAGIDVNKYRPLLQSDFDINPNKMGFIHFRGVNRNYTGNNTFTLSTEDGLLAQVNLAKENKLLIGVYHRLIAMPSTKANPFQSAKDQAQVLINAITAIGGLQPGMWPIVDIERKPAEASSEVWAQLTPEERMNFITTFNYTIEVKYGIKPIVYMQESFVNEFLTGASNLNLVTNQTNYNNQLTTLGRHLLWEVNIDGFPQPASPFTFASFSQVSFGERTTNLRPVPLTDQTNPDNKKDQDIFNGNFGQLVNSAYKPNLMIRKLNDKGLVVAFLQKRLKDLGFYSGAIGLNKNAIFDSATKTAVINYQNAKGLSADGEIGQITRNKMYNIN
jgi:Putative peptidoglycan binding domain/Glycosyl hydrolases family 25